MPGQQLQYRQHRFKNIPTTPARNNKSDSEEKKADSDHVKTIISSQKSNQDPQSAFLKEVANAALKTLSAAKLVFIYITHPAVV